MPETQALSAHSKEVTIVSVNEQMVQDIVQEVMAKLQISSDVTDGHGVFRDMNDAIAAAM